MRLRVAHFNVVLSRRGGKLRKLALVARYALAGAVGAAALMPLASAQGQAGTAPAIEAPKEAAPAAQIATKEAEQTPEAAAKAATAADGPNAPVAEASKEATPAEITITGSRIQLSPGMYTPTPVTAVTQDELVKMAPTNLIDSLSNLPQFYGNSTYQQALGGQTPSGSEVNLRGANTSSGISRTLVLLDGARTVPNSRFGAVDIASFPDELVKSVEVVTGGASASYGTDAVAGVVNFILDTKFEGLKLQAQGGITARNDGPTDKFSITAGHMFGDKLHIMGSISEFNQNSISTQASLESRPWFNQASRVSGPPGGPTYIVAPYVIPTNWSYNGTISNPGLSVNGMQFSPDGRSLLPAPVGVLGAVGDSCACLATANETYGVNAQDEVAGGYMRRNGFVHVSYDVNDHLQVYGQGLFSDDSASVRWQSAALVDSSWQVPIGLDNPFLSSGVRSQIQSSLLAAYPNGPAGPGTRYVYPGLDGLATQYFNYGVYLENTPGNPLGETRQITSNNTKEGKLGFKAELGGDWHLDGYFQQGETLQDYVDVNGTRTDRLFFAMDAITGPNGSPQCRVASQQYDPQYYKYFQDCVPINLFGGWNNISPQAAAYVSGPTKIAKQYYDLTNGELSTNGTLFKGIGAGPVKVAFGVDWRKESLFQTTPNASDDYPAFLNGQLIGNVIGTSPASFHGVIPQGFYINQNGYSAPWPAGAPIVNVNGQQTGGIPGLYYIPQGFIGSAAASPILFSGEQTIAGDTTVKEAFTEFNVPLLKGKPFFESLSANLAYRFANYSGSGNVSAYKFGLDWAINDTIRLRATRSRDVRAASLEERFSTTRGGVTVANPYLPGDPIQSAYGFVGGNPALAPEKADTWTAGFVLTPQSLVQGLSFSVDWYNIDINDAINQPTAQEIVNAAFGGDPEFKALVKLDPNNNIVEVDQYFINFSEQDIQGVDLEASYRRSVNFIGGNYPENLALRLYATDMIKNATLTQFGTYTENAGVVGTMSLPKQKYTVNLTYDKGPYSGFVQGRYISHGILDNTLVQSQVAIPGVETINDNSVGGIFYMDANITYEVPALSGDLGIWFEVNNLLDRAPPTTAGTFGRTGAFSLNGELYDIIGRRYTLGVRYKL